MKPLVPLAVIALTCFSGAARAEDDGGGKEKPAEAESATPPEAHYPPPSTRLLVLTTGVLITGAAWGISYGAAVGWPYVPPSAQPPLPLPQNPSGPPGSDYLKIPIAGPWMALAKSGCGSDEPNCTIAKPIARGVAYVIDGVVQLGGLGLIAEALIMKTESAAPAPKSSAMTLRYRGIEVTPAPVVTPGMTGLSLAGTF